MHHSQTWRVLLCVAALSSEIGQAGGSGSGAVYRVEIHLPAAEGCTNRVYAFSLTQGGGAARSYDTCIEVPIDAEVTTSRMGCERLAVRTETNSIGDHVVLTGLSVTNDWVALNGEICSRHVGRWDPGFGRRYRLPIMGVRRYEGQVTCRVNGSNTYDIGGTTLFFVRVSLVSVTELPVR